VKIAIAVTPPARASKNNGVVQAVSARVVVMFVAASSTTTLYPKAFVVVKSKSCQFKKFVALREFRVWINVQAEKHVLLLMLCRLVFPCVSSSKHAALLSVCFVWMNDGLQGLQATQVVLTRDPTIVDGGVKGNLKKKFNPRLKSQRETKNLHEYLLNSEHSRNSPVR
jgi:hypothetical protein